MKDEKLEVLLQTVLEDVTAIRVALDPEKTKKEIIKIQSDQMEKVIKEIESIKAIAVNNSKSQNSEIDQQRVIDLKNQIDRLMERFSNQENLLGYYFAPKVAFFTIIFSLSIFLSGALLEKLRSNFKNYKTQSEFYEDDGR